MRTTRYSILAAALAALCLTPALAQASPDGMLSGVVVTSSTGQLEIETADGRKTFQVGSGVVMPADLEPGDLVLVSVIAPGSLEANRILIVNDTIVVTEDKEAEQAVVGTVTAISPQQLIVETMTGGQAFVIAPEKLFPPLPQPDQRVAVTYRTVEVHPPQYMATGLVVLSDDFQTSRLDATESQPTLSETDPLATTETQELAESDTTASETAIDDSSWRETPPTVSTQVAQADDADQDDSTYAEATLPQTAGSLPALLGVGLLAIGLGAALRFAR